MDTKEKARLPAGRVDRRARNDSRLPARLSLRSAINAKCRECIHDPAAPGTWREQVAQCTVIRCGLWPVRPAPSGGPFADPPRDPGSVTREWLTRPHGWANSSHRPGLPHTAGGEP